MYFKRQAVFLWLVHQVLYMVIYRAVLQINPHYWSNCMLSLYYISASCCIDSLFLIVLFYERYNKVRELATLCLPWQQWTETSVWFDDVGIAAVHSYVVDLWQSLSEWCVLLSECVLVCHCENVINSLLILARVEAKSGRC
jgi:hypothetical protein